MQFVGKVYNITHYIRFHPGGKEDLMKGAGKDCTILFDEVREVTQALHVENFCKMWFSCSKLPELALSIAVINSANYLAKLISLFTHLEQLLLPEMTTAIVQ